MQQRIFNSSAGWRSPFGNGGMSKLVLVCLFILSDAASSALFAQTPRAKARYDAAWLRYARIDDKAARDRYASLPATVVALGDSPVVKSAQSEVIRGLRGMLGRTLRGAAKVPEEKAIVLGTYEAVTQAIPAIGEIAGLGADSYVIRSVDVAGETHLVVTASNDRGVLNGAFALLRRIGLEQPCENLNERQAPHVPLRLLNQYDHLDGTVERGYAGASLFWEAGHVTKDLKRVRDYARLLASVGLNGVSINDESTGDDVLSAERLPELAALADALRPWGLRLYVATDLAGLRKSAGIAPDAAFDEQGAKLWAAKIDEIYQVIPDMGGLVLSFETASATGSANVDNTGGASGTQEAVTTVNAIAAALKPHGGVLFYRVASDTPPAAPPDAKHDPSMAAFLRFHGLDGQLDENVILQIPAGPIAGHLRQPPSPLFGALEKTNQAIEFDLTQQFFGQQRHLCFLISPWKALLDFDMHAGDAGTPVKKIVAAGAGQGAEGRGQGDGTSAAPRGAFVVITNAGRGRHWLRDPLAMANLYGFGRLAWNPDLASKSIAEEWGRLTFGHDPLVVGTIVELLLQSWQVYENYTGPLGLGTLTDHKALGYGPDLSSSESAGSPPRHGASETGVGVDRTTATGTGFVAQYRPPVAKVFESLATTPDELVLFFHHVPYTHPLKSGRSVIQHIYNSHYEAARDAARMVDKWQLLEGRIDDERFRDILQRLHYQAGHAQVWRDAVCNWFLRKSGIADDEGRVGNAPNRFEAESMQLEGFEAKNVTPWETASGGQCAASVAPTGKGAVSLKYAGEPGWYDLSVCYFDENDGTSKFQLLVAGEIVDEWLADDSLPDNEPNGHTSTRHITRSIALRKDDVIRIEATADNGERAAIDYLEINAVKH